MIGVNQRSVDLNCNVLGFDAVSVDYLSDLKSHCLDVLDPLQLQIGSVLALAP
jgi:hypothetical protein